MQYTSKEIMTKKLIVCIKSQSQFTSYSHIYFPALLTNEQYKSSDVQHIDNTYYCGIKKTTFIEIYDGIAISIEKDVKDSLTYRGKYILGLC